MTEPLGGPKTWMSVVRSIVPAYALAARSAMSSMWKTIDLASVGTWTTATSVRSSLAYR